MKQIIYLQKQVIHNKSYHTDPQRNSLFVLFRYAQSSTKAVQRYELGVRGVAQCLSGYHSILSLLLRIFN